MRGVTITLRGRSAVIAVLVVFGLLAARAVLGQRSFNEAGREAVCSHLRSEYLRRVVRSLPTGRPVSEADGERLLREQRIELRSAAARGSGRDKIVRVEVAIDGRTPPDGRSVRYLRVRHSAWSNSWYVWGDSTALAYYTRLL